MVSLSNHGLSTNGLIVEEYVFLIMDSLAKDLWQGCGVHAAKGKDQHLLRVLDLSLASALSLNLDLNLGCSLYSPK